MVTKEEVADLFIRGLDCSQIVAGEFARECGMTREQMIRLTGAYGGGMDIGETCGAVMGAMVVLGFLYGQEGPDQDEQKAIAYAKRDEFLKAWGEKRPACSCRVLLGHDISIPSELEIVRQERTMYTLCPELVVEAIEIVRRIIS